MTKIRGHISFELEFDSWKVGWLQLDSIAKTIEKTNVINKITSMGFEPL